MSRLPLTHSALPPASKLARCADALRRWERINAGHHAEKRTARRFAYDAQAVAVIKVMPERGQAPSLPVVSCEVLTRNLSTGGVGIIVGTEMSPLALDDRAIFLRADALFRPGKMVSVGLKQSGGELIWLSGEIKRMRPIDEGVIEVGIQFDSKTDMPSLNG